MPYYRDTNGKRHFLDDTSMERLLPTGSVQMTDDEVAIALQPTPEQIAAQAAAQQELDAVNAVKGMTKVQTLISETPAKVKADIEAIADLDGLKDAVKTLALIVRILAKRM